VGALNGQTVALTLDVVEQAGAETFLSSLAEELGTGSYRPRRFGRVYILKAGDPPGNRRDPTSRQLTRS
jgi:hypothetical protein